jgi:4-hydroxy-tetrahydrodipicolinate synthase
MFHGSMVALVTPMADDGSVDYAALERLVAFHLDNGTDAIVAVGTTGESATLDFDEHCQVVRRVVELVRGRIPVIAGTGANSTKEAIELTRCGMEAGADACLLVTPYYNKPPQEGLYQHFRTIAEAVPVPQILYNVPGRTGVDMSTDTVERLAPFGNIIGLKDATGSPERAQELVERVGDQLELYSGEDAAACEAMIAGFDGDISVTANVAPALMHEMCAAARNGEAERARELDGRLSPLHKALFCQTSPIPVKWALYEMGLMGQGIRLPLVPLAHEYHETVRAALRETGVL